MEGPVRRPTDDGAVAVCDVHTRVTAKKWPQSERKSERKSEREEEEEREEEKRIRWCFAGRDVMALRCGPLETVCGTCGAPSW